MATQITYITIGTPKEWLKRGRDGFGKAVLKPALEEAITWWHTKALPRHFRSGAASRYGYPQRSRRTLAQKARMARTRNPAARRPLVYTGRTQLMSKRARVSGTARSARVTMNLPAYVQQYDVMGEVRPMRTRALGGYKAIVAADMTRVTADELNMMSRIFEVGVMKRLNEFPGRTIKRTTGVAG